MEQLDGRGTRPVYVLGAGFSKAINSVMPVTGALGDEITSRLVGIVDIDLRRQQSFEQWLTLRLTPMPFLQGFENMSRAADGERVIAAIADVLDECVAHATAPPPPLWLRQLIALWHEERAAILTFNYDTLVERAVNAYPPAIHQGDGASRILGDHVTYPAPAAPPAQILGDMGAPHRHDSLQLLHLHGSLAWYWSSNDATGATLIRVREKHLLGGDRRHATDEDFSATHTLDRYLIPPVTSKEGYYGSYLAISIWRAAKELMESAQSLTVLGYSLPLEDRAASQLFTHLPNHLHVDVADHEPGSASEGNGIVGHLATLGMTSTIVSNGSDAIATFVARKLELAVESVQASPAFDELDRADADVMVALTDHSSAGDSADLNLLVRSEDGMYEAHTVDSIWTPGAKPKMPFRASMHNAMPRGYRSLSDFLTADNLRARVQDGLSFVFTEKPGGRRHVVIGVTRTVVGGWEVLMLATAPFD